MTRETFTRITSLAAALLASLPAAAAFDVPSHPVDVILGRPTSRSVVVSVVAYQDGDGYVEFAPASGGANVPTAVKSLPKEQAVEFLLDGLQADTAYSYRLSWRAGTSGAYTAASSQRFRTSTASRRRRSTPGRSRTPPPTSPTSTSTSATRS